MAPRKGALPCTGPPQAFFAEVSATPSAERFGKMKLNVSKAVAPSVDCLGVPVGTTGAIPAQVGLERAALESAGFKGKIGQALAVPKSEGPAIVAIGVGAPAELSPAKLRDVAAAFARAAGKGKHVHLATTLADVADMPPELAAQAIVEGVLLASYRYDAFKTGKASAAPLAELQLVTTAERAAAMTKGPAARPHAGHRDDAGARPGQHAAVSPQRRSSGGGREDDWRRDGARRRDLRSRGAHQARLRRPAWREPWQRRPAAHGEADVPAQERPRARQGLARPPHLAFVGKGVTYDAGGISLKPSDEMHAQMKLTCRARAPSSLPCRLLRRSSARTP